MEASCRGRAGNEGPGVTRTQKFGPDGGCETKTERRTEERKRVAAELSMRPHPRSFAAAPIDDRM